MIETDYGETMTVAELIAELEKYPSGLPVITQGCDCLGNVLVVAAFDHQSRSGCIRRLRASEVYAHPDAVVSAEGVMLLREAES